MRRKYLKCHNITQKRPVSGEKALSESILKHYRPEKILDNGSAGVYNKTKFIRETNDEAKYPSTGPFQRAADGESAAGDGRGNGLPRATANGGRPLVVRRGLHPLSGERAL